ncbi:MAG: RluA family pseudouridine synthase [Spirochaetales bacterium]|nr:RluA family pseudouridine synthase [Spirochaetales bacterium]
MKAIIPVLLEDPAFLAVDKPAGFLVIPDRYDVLAPVVSVRLEDAYGSLLTVHRLDKDTSGALLYARSAEAHAALSKAFEKRVVEKTYRAVVLGEPEWDETVCEIPLLPDGDPMHRTVADPERGKPSRTRFRVLGRHGRFSLVEAQLDTGRTHQIRVHLKALGHPVACDRLYGDGKPVKLSAFKRKWRGDEFEERPLLARVGLHAFSIAFPHPVTGERVEVEAPYPRDLRALVTQLEKLK